jgi:tetratricopeptide (TPR) repeat protein
LQEPFHVLVTIRRLARQYLIDDLDWDEYYRGLIVTLVGALKYKELDALARTLALTAAATMQGLLGHRLETSQTAVAPATPPPPSRAAFPTLRWAGMAAGLVVLLLLLGGVWRLWSAQATPQPEETPAQSAESTPVQPLAPTPLQVAAPTPSNNDDALAHVGVYADDIAQGWENWSWDVDIANDNTDVYEGTSALRVSFMQPYAGLSLHAPTPVDSSDYQAIDFWIYRANGDSQIAFYTMDSDDAGEGTQVIFRVPTRVWTHMSLPLVDLGSPAQIVRLTWQEDSGDHDAVFYLDDIRITQLANGVVARPTPASPALTPEPTPLPVTAAEGETLLLVSQFTSFASESTYNVAGRIQEALETQLAAAQLMDTRVAVWPAVIDKAAVAQTVLDDTGAAMVIWGEYDSGRIRVNFALPGGQGRVGWQRLLNSPSELSTTINLDVPREVQALALLTVGRLYRDGGDLNQAKAAFEQALAQNPSEPDTVATLSFYLGYLYASSTPAQLDKAIAAYSRTIELRPEWLNARYNRGLAYFDRYWYNGKIDELDAAIADVDVVLAERPNAVEPLINRGIAYYTRNQPGDLALALADFDTAIARDSQSLGGYYNRGLARIRANDRAGWEADLTRARELRPDYTSAIYALCWGYALDNLPEQGLPYCEAVVAEDASDYSRDARGLINAELGRLEEAAADLELYVAWLRKQPRWWYEHYDGAIYADMIDALQAGQNPITDEVLAALR